MASSSPTKNKVAVIGATGRLGRLAVKQLVDQGIPCNILIRNFKQHKNDDALPPPVTLSKDLAKAEVTSYLASLNGVTVMEGDVNNLESLQALVQDCTACLALWGATRRSKISDLWNPNVENDDPTHAKQVNYQGVVKLLKACQASPACKRVVRITGKCEEPYSFFSILINLLGSMAKAWNYQGEQVLRGQTDVEYTIIRPGVMSDDGDGRPANEQRFLLSDNGGDLPVSRVRYADISSLCIQSLSYPNAGRSTLTAMTAKGTADTDADGASSWAPLLAKVRPDTRTFPKDMLEQHKAAVKDAVIKIGAFTTIFSAVFLQFLIKALF